MVLTLAWVALMFAPQSLASGAVFVQQGPELTSDQTVPPVWFGYSVALSADGNTALVGAPAANGGVGATWVFTRTSGVWTRGPQLTATDPTISEEFGFSVALSADGNTALIGAFGHNTFEGAAYVFTRSSAGWTQQGPRLTPSDPSPRGAPTFGESVALSANGDTALIGGGNDDVDVGAAWVFTRSSGVWTQQGPKLTGSDETGAGEFGSSVALSATGNTALIGGPDDYDATNGTYPGAAWIFTRASGAWRQQRPKLTPNNEIGSSSFGRAVAISWLGNIALIGGPNDDGRIGAAWVFKRSAGSWLQGAKLTADDESGSGQFGSSVAVSWSGLTGLIGGPYDVRQQFQQGSAWVFTRSWQGWMQEQPKLAPSDRSAAFGTSVALSARATTALVGDYALNAGLGAAWAFAR